MKNKKSANNSTIQAGKLYYNIKLEQYSEIFNSFIWWWIIFLYGEIWMWKTTISKYIFEKVLSEKYTITSPTYTYYNIYDSIHYHFDLYRLQNYDEFINIWWEEIIDNNSNWIVLIEWPELIESYIQPDFSIHITQWNTLKTRNLRISTPQYLS